MRILKPGREMPKAVLEGECRECGCIFECDEGEEGLREDWYDACNRLKHYTRGCPNCEYKVFLKRVFRKLPS